MSAFLVSKNHIDLLVSTASAWEYSMPRNMTQDQVGQMLWSENVRSLNFRYPNDSEDDATYSWTPQPALTPLAALKAINCLEYQSCEHDGWDKSPAQRFLEDMKSEAIIRLPGYNDLPWGYQ